VSLLAFATDRHVAGQAAAAISCPPGPQQQTLRSAMQRSIDETDRQADAHTTTTEYAALEKRAITVLRQTPGNVEPGRRTVGSVDGPSHVKRFAGKII